MDILNIDVSNPENLIKINSILMDDDQIKPNYSQNNQIESPTNPENFNDQIVQDDFFLIQPEQIVKELVSVLVNDAIEYNTYLQRYSTNNETPYMKRKLESIQNEIIKSFGAESFNYMYLKPVKL